jgi:DNA-binding NtrC family response regulator
MTLTPLRELLAQIEAAAVALDPALRIEFVRVRQQLDGLDREGERMRAQVERHQILLDRTLGVVTAQGAVLVASEVLDVMIAVTGAQRGFVGLVQPQGGWRLLEARAMTEEDIDAPTSEVSTGVIARALESGAPVVAEDALTDWAERGSVQRLGLRSVACLPIRQNGRALGFVYLDHTEAAGRFDEGALAVLDAWLPMVADQLARTMDVAGEDPFPGFVTRSPRLLAELTQLARLAQFDVPVLITGPTGTGKSKLAAALHRRSRRARGPFVHLNCSAVPEALLEGELFGSEAGAYTGSRGRRIGRFEAASGGTLFLDEIDTMPISGQVKLLVALQERTVTRLGSNDAIRLDVRLIAATNADPQRAISEGRLREDLYFRLAGVTLHVPPLKERPEDVPPLIQHILAATVARYGLPPLRLSRRALDRLCGHSWPGNVRELENVLDRAALLAGDRGVIDDVLPLGTDVAEPRRLSVSRQEFLAAWAAANGAAPEVANRLGVAKRSVFRLKAKYLDA